VGAAMIFMICISNPGQSCRPMLGYCARKSLAYVSIFQVPQAAIADQGIRGLVKGAKDPKAMLSPMSGKICNTLQRLRGPLLAGSGGRAEHGGFGDIGIAHSDPKGRRVRFLERA
ncbi:MAG: hypothetical protein QF521_18045, partial [Alphaproteobacteria bacterium]|nr:hypothetical protein [Alphaproteobacteria bacterium]